MLRLSPYEEAMRNGDMGAFKQKAMEFIIRYGEVLGAEELCEVSRATLFIGAQHYLDCYGADVDYESIFSEFYLCSDERLAFGAVADTCSAQTCAAACDYFECERTHQSPGRWERNRAFLEKTKAAGVKIVDSCTPYYVGWVPLFGEHFVTTESSNVVISNSVFGARGNSDGVEAAVCAAITGRIPKWGMHDEKNRFGTCLFHVECRDESMLDWDVLGFTMGRLMPKHQVPVISKRLPHPDIHKLRQLCASLSVTSAAEICHIVGLTPEALTLDMALGGKQAAYEIVVTQKDYDESLAMLCDSGEGAVDFVSVGCPHLSLDELRAISIYLEGKRLAPGVELQIWTDYATRAMADVNGYTQAIEASGAAVLTGTCPIVMGKEAHRHAKAMVMFGAKQAFGIRHQTKAPVYYGDVFRCIDAALTGRWEVAST